MPFPWPGRTSRHEAIAAARAERRRSQAGAASAKVVRADIEAMWEQNHFAQAIAEDIIRRHRGQGA